MASSNTFMRSPTDELIDELNAQAAKPIVLPDILKPSTTAKSDTLQSTSEVTAPRIGSPSRGSSGPTSADVRKRAGELGVDPALALSIWSQESSSGRNPATSDKGARGGFQVMPGTFRSMLGSADQANPWNNMEAGLRYLAYGQKTLGTSNPALLAAGYHAGYDREDLKQGRIPNTSDGHITTADYAKQVAARVAKNGGEPDDAGRFVPLSDEELVQAAHDGSLDAARYQPLSDDEYAAAIKGGAQVQQDTLSTSMPRDAYQQAFMQFNPGASPAALQYAMGEYDKAQPKQQPQTEAKAPPPVQTPEQFFDQRLNQRLQQDGAGGVVPPLPGKLQPDQPKPYDENMANAESKLSAVGSYLGRSLQSGAYNLAAAGARIADVLDPTTISPGDMAVLFKNDPEGLKKQQEEGSAMYWSRLADQMQKNADESMSKLSDRAKRDYGSLEYATTDQSKAAYLSPVKVVGDALNSLPTSVAMAASIYLTRGAAAQAEKQALATGMTEEAARQAGIQAGQKAMATYGATSEGAVGAAQQANQTVQDVNKVPMAEMAKSPKFQQLLKEGFTPETARAKIIADTAQEAGQMAGIVDAAVNHTAGEFMGKILTEGGKFLPRVMKGGANEAVTEFVQSGGEQFSQNKATKDNVNPNQSLMQGVGENAVQGAFVGGLMGGTMAGAGGRGHIEAPAVVPGGTEEYVASERQAAATPPSVPPTKVQAIPAEAAPAPKSATPLASAMEHGAGGEQRVVATTPDGQQAAGTMQAYHEDEAGHFQAQILGDDGQMYTITDHDGVQLTPVAAPKGPLTASLETAADQHAAEQVTPAAEKVPEMAPAAVPEVPARVEPMKPGDMSDAQLADRLKYLATQFKSASDRGVQSRIAVERKAVEKEINARAQAVEQARQAAEAAKPVSMGPYTDRADANSAALKAAEQTNVPHEVVEQGDKFTIQPIQEASHATDGTERAASGRDAARMGAADSVGTGADRLAAGRAEGTAARSGPEMPVDLPVAERPANAVVPLKDAHANKWFSTPEKAQAYIAKQKIGATHRVEQTGRVRFEVRPRESAVSGTEALAAAKDKYAKQDEAVRQAAENLAARKATKGEMPTGRPSMPEVVALGPTSFRTIPIQKRLYRETNASGLDDILRSHNEGSISQAFLADNKDIALGQGSNKGIHVEFRPGSVSGREHVKPGTGDTAGREYRADFIGPDAVDRITVAKGEKVRGLSKLRLSQLFDRAELPDGSAQYTRKGLPKTEIDTAAHEAATSPLNDLPEPTQAQKEAGNYAKGHINVHGLDISIENPRGSERSGQRPDGTTWSHTMSDHYGYIRRTEGADGDHVDVYVGPKPESKQVYVVDQLNQKDGSFDEHKVLMGYGNRQQAVAAYRANFDKGWKVGPVKGMNVDQFKTWLKEGDTTKPIAQHQTAANPTIQGEQHDSNDRPVQQPNGPEKVERQPEGSGKASTKQASAEAQEVKAAAAEKPKRAPKDEPASEQSAPAAPIADFGEKIHGARKDIWTGFKESMQGELPANVKDITLAKHFPEPNYGALIEAGVEPKVLAAFKALRDTIPAKPRVPYKAKRWGEQVATLRDFANSILNGHDKADDIINTLRLNGLPTVAQRMELYAGLGYPAFTKAKDYSLEMHHYTMFDGKSPPGGITKWELNNAGSKFRSTYFDTQEEGIAALRKKLDDTPEGQGGKQVSLDLYKVTATGDIVIGKKVASGKFIDLKTGFKGVREAREYLAAHRDELLALLEKKKDVRPERRGVNEPRVGEDRRKGEDISPEQFGNTFGFRGVQFGNYVEQKRRASDLNNAYDALHDLADTIGVPPEALSLNGTLGLAFGARGAGGKNAPAAHYEPGHVVINLTKTNGAGSLAHEWFHGLDNYFAKMRSGDGSFITQSPKQKMVPNSERRMVPDESIRPETLDAFKGVVDAIRNSGMLKRSRELDGRRSKDYWSTIEELSARAFESYVIDKAAEQGHSNDYLANIVSEKAHNAMNDMANMDEPYPYPLRSEAPGINSAFDKLFSTLKTKEEGGKTALYSVADDGKPQAEFGPVHTEYRDDVKGAVQRLLDDKTGEAIVHTDQLGDISLVYGDAKTGLAHIEKRRGPDFMQRLPEILQDGTLYSKPGQKDRVFLGTDSHEAVLRLEWDGKAKTWLLSAYEKYPDLKPLTEAQQSRRSEVVDERSAAPLDKEELRAAVTQGVLGQVVHSMIDAGVVKLHDTPATLPRAAGRNVKGVQAVTMPDGTIHLVASNLTEKNANAVMLHEAFHEGAEKLLGNERWGKLMGQIGSLYRQSERSSGKAREFFDRARERVAAAKEKGAVATKMEPEEFAAYAIEEYESAPKTIQKWVDDLLGAVKAWLSARFGKQFGDVTPAQLAAIAKMALMDHAVQRRGEIFGDKGLWFSVAKNMADTQVLKMSRQQLQEVAKKFGFKASNATELLRKQVGIMMKNPHEWSQSDLDAVAHIFQIHQDTRAGSEDRVADIMKNGLKSGMSDNLGNMVSGGFTWGKQLQGGDAYLFLAKDIKYASPTSGWFAPGNIPFMHIKTEKGQSILDAIHHGELVNEGESAPRYSTQAAKQAQAPIELTPPEQGKLRRLQAAVQDNMNRVREVQDRITELAGRKIGEAADYYGAETNRPGRIAARLEDAQTHLFAPLMERLAKSGYTQEQLSEYLHAQHAQERNEAVAKINPKMPDGGSGMTNDEAATILKLHEKDTELQALAQQARDITKATLDLKQAYGLISQETHDGLSKMYDYYVPLKGDGEYGPKVKRAMGHDEREEHILENIARDYDQAVVVGEKNLARQALLRLVLQNPDPFLWTVGVPPKGRYIAGQTYNVMHNGKQVASFDSRPQVEAYLEGKGPQAANYTVQNSNGEQVQEFVKPLQDNEVMVYVKGDPVRIQIQDEKLAQQLRPLNQGQMHPILETMRGMNRFFSKIYTGYNPSFIIRNASRDAITGSINMLGNEGAVTAAKAWSKYPASVAALAQYAATGNIPDGKTGRMLTEYRNNGGKTGASHMSDLEQQGKTLTRLFEDAYGATAYAADGKPLKAAKVAGRKIVGGMAHVVEIANQATENALRLALYTTLRDQGVSPAKAAQAAKAVTVNFDRKGTMTGALGALYLFFNPAVQGTANAIKTLAKGEHKAQAWAGLGAIATLGFLAAAKGMDEDKDRWLGEGWDTRSKNFIMHSGGREFRMPMSQEFAPAYALGTALAEASRGESKMRTSARLMSSFLDAYFPLQGAYHDGSDNPTMDAAMALTPTALKPAVQIAANRNTFGSQIVPETETTKDRPDNLKMFRSTKNTPYDAAAQGIASFGEMMGAGKYENDLSKVSPETLKMLWRTYAGGLGQFVADSANWGGMLVDKNQSAGLTDTPIVKDFLREDDVKAIRARYQDQAKDVKAAFAEFEQAKKLGDGPEISKIVDDPAKLKLIAVEKLTKAVSKASGQLRDQMVTINADQNMTPAQKKDAVKALEKEEEDLYRNALEAFR